MFLSSFPYGFKPYSLGRGGATDLWFTTHNYSHVAHMGRWSSERTLKVCIQDSVALLTDLHFVVTTVQRELQQYWTEVSRVEPPKSRTIRGQGRNTRFFFLCVFLVKKIDRRVI